MDITSLPGVVIVSSATPDLMTTVAQVKDLWMEALTVIAFVIAFASAVSATFKKRTGIVGFVQDLINLVALNLGHAKNPPAPPSA